MCESDGITKKIVESISEDPQIEPGQADTTPATQSDQERGNDQPEQNQAGRTQGGRSASD